MELLAVLIIAALVFGVCFLVDKGFAKLFRSQAQHFSGLSVRLNKKFAAFGLILFVLGLAAVFAGLSQGLLLIIGGSLILVVGIGLVVYYMTFGVFYDEDTFLLTSFGKKSKAYRYEEIAGQLLYNSGGHIIVELHMADGRTFHLQSAQAEVVAFLDKAFAVWCRQRGVEESECEFHDTDNSCWFPSMEES